MTQPTLFSSSKDLEPRYNNKRYYRRMAIDEVDDEEEKAREMKARQLADKRALRNPVQPTK